MPPPNNTLVALIPSKEDFQIAQTQHWYRIPTRIKRVPQIVKEGRLQFLAFYHPKVFGPWAHSIRFVAPVKSVSIAKRKDLVPVPAAPAAQTGWQKKAEEEYYKIEIGELGELPNVIYSRTWRRLVFLETTNRKLYDTTEVNDLFSGSALEEHFYTA